MNELNNILTAEEYKTLDSILSKIANHTIYDKRIISYNTAFGTIKFTDTEQKQIDDKAMSDILFIQHQMLIEKAIKWVRYNNNNGGCHFDGWEKSLIKSME